MATTITSQQLIQDRIVELRENTDFVSTLLESPIGYAIIATDYDGNIIAYNKGAQKIYGYDPEELIGKQDIGIFFPAEFIEAGKLQKMFDGLIKEEIFSYEGENVRKDGVTFPARVLLTLRKDKNGKMAGFVEIVEDLTALSCIEERWWDSMTNFYKVINNNPDGVIIIDKEGSVLFANPAAEVLFGKKSGELKNTPFGLPIILGDTTEIDITRRGSNELTVEMHVVETVWLDKPAYLASFHDVTERKQTAEKLLESEKLYSTMANSSPIGVFITQDGRFMFVNEQFCKTSGYTKDELIGLESLSLVHPEDQDMVRENAIKMLKGQTIDSYEYRFLRKNGDTLVILETLASIRYQGKRACLGNYMDITEREQTEQDMKLLAEQLQARVSELETFSYGIAHDLRSPLISIEGFCHLLREDMLNQDKERVNEDIRLLESGVNKMRGFLNETLEYSRAGQLIKRTENISFGKIAEEVISEFAEEIRSIGATASIAETFPSLYADRMRIKQVLTNLIQNSIKYRDNTRPLKIEVGYHLSKGEAIFFVRDNGTGIGAGEKEKIFTLFYRGTAEVEGSGIGLAIVKKIIEAHGGKIWVESQPGNGATMCFSLPQKSDANKGDTDGKD